MAVSLTNEDHYFSTFLLANDELRKKPVSVVILKDQAAEAIQLCAILNDQCLFPQQPDGFYYELPLATGSIFFAGWSDPGSLRAIYNPLTGETFGVIGHRGVRVTSTGHKTTTGRGVAIIGR
ncbi:hypothetical protein V8E54_007937 [Elaphomyces granulatus]